MLVENRANFIPHLYLAPPQRVTPSEFREHLGIHKTKMNGLSCGDESMTRRSAVLIPCQRVTDGRTDGLTHVKTNILYCTIVVFNSILGVHSNFATTKLNNELTYNKNNFRHQKYHCSHVQITELSGA